MRTLFVIALVVALSACSAPAVPDQSYFRMPPVAITALAEPSPRSPLPIVVEPFRANGVYNDQSILYALSPDGSIKVYHYQMWDEAPSILLQRRLIADLRARDAADLVSNRLPAAVPALRVSGNIEQFERVQTDSGWVARVRIELRVERNAQSVPLLLHTYAAEVAAENDSIQSSVRAFARAVDQCHAEFWSDLPVAFVP
ncbi:MAG: membrane integrity-associated transporter subunit PqiC [Rhodanobacteraceae bacterium]|nr:membrane integrity-associated transporter subunit PqiC [Rhodanobacteraceae bacterium]MBP9153395.1 membrane integrity-associated transporter subunit PqiC [Xanthomonadales bacterium]HQW82421.1 ABC-type transport auxiliary lipoprotein family protein [Pseudomonadota bacterium]